MALPSPVQTIFIIAHFNISVTYLTPLSINLLICNVKIFILQAIGKIKYYIIKCACHISGRL